MSRKTQLPLAIGLLLVASLACTLVLAGAAPAATRSFAPLRQQGGTAVFKLKGVEAGEIEAAYLRIGRQKRKLNVERVRAATRRGVLRVRVRRAASRSSVDAHGRATRRSNPRLVVVTSSETLATESVSSTTFAPSADSYTSAGKPSRNYGKASSLVTEGSPSSNGYLRFDIGGLEGTVTHVTLKLFARSNSSVGLSLHPVSDNGWVESAISYANAPAIGAKVADSGPMNSGTYVSLDVTQLVKGNGLVSMAVKTTSATSKTLDSREGTNKPSLVVETASTTSEPPPPTSPPPPPTGTDPQPAFPVRAAFYYPWFPETWAWPSGSTPDSSNFTNFTPSLGFYDSASVSVIQQHVRAMQYGGVGAGISSWWGPGHRTDTRFQTMLSATNSMTSSFRWALYHENESLGDPTVATLASDLTYIRDRYASDPGYFRVNGRFVVFVYADGGDGCGMADRWKQANAGINAYIVLKVFSGYRVCFSQPDSWHQYSPAAPADSQSGYSYAISPGFWKADELTARLGRDLTRFKTNVRDMVASNAPFQLVTTFNEWGEGTAVESAAQWSSASGNGDYLDALHDNGQPSSPPPPPPPSNQAPAASFGVSPNPALTNQSVTFNGSASADSDGSITNYKWDLDGNGTFETDSGSSATTSRTYTSTGSITVKLRVTDNGGASAEASRTLTVDATPSGRLRFGLYPWGAAGATTTIAPSVPENSGKSLAAVQQLRGGKPFVVHLYADYTGTSNASADGLLSEATWWAANGLHVAAVLRYRPADASKASGYKAWVAVQTRRLVALDKTVSIQIGNEPNNLSPGAGDGSYPGVIDAIAGAVPVARQEAVAAGRSDVLIGFNWAAGLDPTTTELMWGELRRVGGSAFTQAVGFVGVNVYPGTWSPPAAASVPIASQVDATVRATLDALRTSHMPAAGIGSSAAVVIAETGYPTTPARSEATQDIVLNAVVAAAEATKHTHGVTDIYWFALRDGNTASGQLENGYGLLRDDYSAKPAFESFRQLIATVGA